MIRLAAATSGRFELLRPFLRVAIPVRPGKAAVERIPIDVQPSSRSCVVWATEIEKIPLCHHSLSGQRRRRIFLFLRRCEKACWSTC